MGIVTNSTDKYQACINECNSCAQACLKMIIAKKCTYKEIVQVISGFAWHIQPKQIRFYWLYNPIIKYKLKVIYNIEDKI
jgi:hypothetical protein